MSKYMTTTKSINFLFYSVFFTFFISNSMHCLIIRFFSIRNCFVLWLETIRIIFILRVLVVLSRILTSSHPHILTKNFISGCQRHSNSGSTVKHINVVGHCVGGVNGALRYCRRK